MAHSFRRLTMLLLVLCAAARAASSAAATELAVDGVRPGMSIAEVVKVLGPPQAVRWEKGHPYFVYPPQKGQARRSVWFIDGRVAFVYGRTLFDGGTAITQAGDTAAVLLRRMGTPEELNVFSCWWPKTGVVVSAWREVKPDDTLEAIGLRSLDVPIEWVVSQPVTSRWSSSEPWMDDYEESWRMDGIPLGITRADLRKAAGAPARQDALTDVFKSGLIVHYSRSGFVRKLEGGSTLTLLAHLGHHVLTQGPWHVGQPMSFRALLKHGETVPLAPDGVTELAPQVRVTQAKGVPTRFVLVGDEAIYDALDSVAR